MPTTPPARLRLFQLLALLTQPEYTRLGKFLRSPFFNQSDPPRRLYAVLKPYFPDFAPERVLPETVWERVYPDKPFKAAGYWRLCSDLTKLVERFLTELELERQPRLAGQLQLEALAHRDNYALLLSARDRHLKALENQSLRNIDYYRAKAAAEWVLLDHPDHNHYKREEEALYRKLEESISGSALLNMLRLKFYLKNRQRVLPSDLRLSFDSWIDQMTPEFPITVVKLYQSGFAILEGKTELLDAHYELLETAHGEISTEELRMFYRNALNAVLRKYNRGDSGYALIAVRWYELGLAKEWLTIQGILSVISAINIVFLYGLLGRLEAGKNFVRSYGALIDSRDRDEFKIFSAAVFSFHQGDFEDAISNCYKVSEFNPNVGLLSRNLVVRATFQLYLDQPEFNVELLHTRMNSFETYVLRIQNRTESYKRAQLALIKLLRQIISRKAKGEADEVIAQWLIAELEKPRSVASKRWLSELLN